MKALNYCSIWILGLTVLFSALSCKSAKKRVYERTPIITEQVVQRLVKTNDSRATIIKLFGLPTDEEKISNNKSIANYVFFENDIRSGWTNKFIGFQICYSNDAVTSWKPVFGDRYYGGLQSSQQQTKQQLGALKEGQELEFYVVSETALNNGSFVNSTNLPNLGYIHSVPELRVHQLKSAKSGIANEISLSLFPDDARKFSEITASNAGKRMLVCLNNIALVAPYISIEIDSGEFAISNLGDVEYKRLHSALRELNDSESAHQN